MNRTYEPVRQTQLSLPLTASRPKTSPAAVQALPPEAVAHREAFVRYVLENATPWHRTYLGRLYRLWEEWSREYFTGHSLVPPYILLSEPLLRSLQRRLRIWGARTNPDPTVPAHRQAPASAS
jgi:hypothetical protein